MPQAFGTAIRNWFHDERDAPLLYRDGAETSEHPIEEYYFGDFQDSQAGDWIDGWVEGPLVDLGAGAGRDTLHFQKRYETIALEVSESLVTLLEERGVEDARLGDMFDLRSQFGPDRFRSVLSIGTQACLAGSVQGLRRFLSDLAYVTTPEATVVLDSYDPDADGVEEMLGFRDDPAPGLAHRVAWFEYGDLVDPVLHFRLFGPDRLRAAADATGWAVRDVIRPYGPESYKAALEKR